MKSLYTTQAHHATKLRRGLFLTCFWVLVLLHMIPVSHATERFHLCTPIVVPTDEFASFRERQLRFFATHALIDREGISSLSGDVTVYYEGRQLHAQQVHYDAVNAELKLETGVSLTDAALQLEADDGHLLLDTEAAEFHGVTYRYVPAHARGGAQRLQRQGSHRTLLHEASYTTCDPERNDWLLSAKRVVLKQDEGQGSARNVWLHFYDIPIFYTPWISFPLDDRRKSGLLPPRVGNADSTGMDIEIPYYFNLAPQYDATLAARIMTHRGTMLDTELRYLDENYQGILSFDYLPDDIRYAADRSLLRWQHQATPFSRVRVDIDAGDVSDQDYFKHFGSSLAMSSTTHLERRAEARYLGDHFILLGRVQGYQTLDPTITTEQRPYQRLPQIVLHTHTYLGSMGLDYGLNAEWVSFARTDSMTANRFDITPRVSALRRGSFWFVNPVLKYRYTHYTLHDTPDDLANQHARALPIASINSGLFLERSLRKQRLQTLEPKLYYLYTPYRDQDALPLFDTAPLEFSFDQLFREERFTGADRVGDANQMTVGLTSRILDPAMGGEWLRASIGQIIYLEDRRVGLYSDDVTQTAQRSSLVGELGWRPGATHTQAMQNTGFDLRLGIQGNTQDKILEQAGAHLHYRMDNQRVVNLSYRFREHRQQQTDLSFAWPLSHRIEAVGRWNYSLRDTRELEAFAGFEYSSCCWGLRVVARRHLTYSGDGDYNNGIYAQLILKGLTSMGTGLGGWLEESIPGYATLD